MKLLSSFFWQQEKPFFFHKLKKKAFWRTLTFQNTTLKMVNGRLRRRKQKKRKVFDGQASTKVWQHFLFEEEIPFAKNNFCLPNPKSNLSKTDKRRKSQGFLKENFLTTFTFHKEVRSLFLTGWRSKEKFPFQNQTTKTSHFNV